MQQLKTAMKIKVGGNFNKLDTDCTFCNQKIQKRYQCTPKGCIKINNKVKVLPTGLVAHDQIILKCQLITFDCKKILIYRLRINWVAIKLHLKDE